MKVQLLVLLAILAFFSFHCSEKIISRQDILDLLEDDKGSAGGNPSTSSNSNSDNNPNNTPISNSQNLDYYGLTNSPTGTTTGGSIGFPAGANPTGR